MNNFLKGVSTFSSLRNISTRALVLNQAKKPSAGASDTSKSKSSESESVDTTRIDPPKQIFSGEPEGNDLGPGASKDGEYKNPEYFQYHAMSYAEMELIMLPLRCPQPNPYAST